MRITHICLGGPYTDNFTYQDNLLTKYQVINGHIVTIIASKWQFDNKGNYVLSNKSDYVNSDGVIVKRLPMYIFEHYNNKFQIFKGLYDVVDSSKPDVIFVHGSGSISNIVIAKYAKKHKVRIYADNHSDFSNTGRNWISKYILQMGFGRLFANILEPYVTKFYGVLPIRVDYLTDVYRLPESKCELLVLGADDSCVSRASDINVKRAIRSKYNIEHTDFLIVTGGKIDAFKKQTILLLKAIKRFSDKRIKIIVFGSVVDELKEEIQALVDQDRILYIGWIDSKYSYDIFASADLVVFPGRHSVFWEQAAAQGIPMLCKYWPGTQHVDLGGNVKFIYDDSIECIYDNLKNIIYNKECYNKMKTIAVDKGMKYFSYQEIAKRAIEE